MAFQGLKNVIGAFRSRRSSRTGVYESARKVKALLEHRETDEAERILLEALENYPGHSSLEDINHFLGQKRLQDSLGLLRRSVEETRKGYIRAARAVADIDNHDKAIEFITGAFRRFPECPELHLILGEIHLRLYLADRIPEDGRQAAESLERACRLDPKNPLPRKYLAGLYARVGCFRRAMEYLTALTGKETDEEEQRYIEELGRYCAKHAGNGNEEDFVQCLTRVWENGEFAMDCRDWASPRQALFGRRDARSTMVPFVALEVTARRCVELPGVRAVVVQNQARSLTFRTGGAAVDETSLENLVRDVVARSTEACHRMRLGRVKHCQMRTTTGQLSLHVFADSCVGLLFRDDVSATQVRTVTQQFLDLVAERMGEIHEDHS